MLECTVTTLYFLGVKVRLVNVDRSSKLQVGVSKVECSFCQQVLFLKYVLCHYVLRRFNTQQDWEAVLLYLH